MLAIDTNPCLKDYTGAAALHPREVFLRCSRGICEGRKGSGTRTPLYGAGADVLRGYLGGYAEVALDACIGPARRQLLWPNLSPIPARLTDSWTSQNALHKHGALSFRHMHAPAIRLFTTAASSLLHSMLYKFIHTRHEIKRSCAANQSFQRDGVGVRGRVKSVGRRSLILREAFCCLRCMRFLSSSCYVRAFPLAILLSPYRCCLFSITIWRACRNRSMASLSWA